MVTDLLIYHSSGCFSTSKIAIAMEYVAAQTSAARAFLMKAFKARDNFQLLTFMWHLLS